jgi:hypothetical protein
VSNLYEDLYLAAAASESDPEADYVNGNLQKAALAFLNQFGTGDLAAVINFAESHLGENAHMMESEEVADLRAAIERLEGVYE